MARIIFTILCILIFSNYFYGQIYIAPDGDDNDSGTIDQPFATFTKAISEITPGDTIYARGGIYNLINTITINFVQSGSPNQFCTLTAYKDEVPILDFSAQSFGSKGISLKANYWHIKGLQVTGAGDNGMEINFGSNNVIEQCQFYRNRDTGLQLSNLSAKNRIINCDSYFNADSVTNYANADGFAPKLTVGDSNYFYGCRSWVNCDDGWDGYLRGADDVHTILENCWTWGNGYLEDGSDGGPFANGNGFKMGGGDNSNSDSLMHHFTLINCVAFSNKNKGFDQNNNLGSMTLYNCTGYNNLAANYRIQRALNPGQTLTVKNCVSFLGNVQLGSFAVQETNSWLSPFVVTADDFLSLDIALASAPRQADGSLPEIQFLHLAQGSDLIDAGVDLGFPYNGTAPDLGAFESDYTTYVQENTRVAISYQLLQNYPNPFNPSTTIEFSLKEDGFTTLKVFDITGREVETLVNQRMKAGAHHINYFNPNLATGIYFYRIKSGDFVASRKMIIIK
jgi:hypothetical protein